MSYNKIIIMMLNDGIIFLTKHYEQTIFQYGGWLPIYYINKIKITNS